MELQSHKKKVLEQFRRNYIMIISFLLIFIAGITVGIGVYELAFSNKSAGVKKAAKVNNLKNNSLANQKPLVLNTNSTLKKKKLPAKKEVIPPPNIFPEKVLFKDRKLVIEKGNIDWVKPFALKDIGLTTKETYRGCNLVEKSIEEKCLLTKNWSSAIKYIKVGEINTGEYKGNDLIIISGRIGSGFTGFGMENIYILRRDKQITFLIKHSGDSSKQNIKQHFLEGEANNFIIDEGVSIKSLEFPMRIGIERGVLEKNKYEKSFFIENKLKPIFKSPIYGQVWMTEHKKNNNKATKYELNSYMDYDSKNKKFIKKYEDIFGKEAFFIKSPDGTAISYKMVFDIFDKSNVLKATWNDGKINEGVYITKPSGCGGGDYYVYNVTGSININTQLIQVGHTITGDAVYGYKDDTSKLFQDFYKNIYTVEPGEKKNGLKYVLDNHLQVFWVDPFGRLLTFYKTESIGMMAECGKPVIYLYPEKAMDINVQVEPNQGISISEPKYPNNGWDVFAKPSGELTFENKKYPYLFWEGASDVSYEQSRRGWVVRKKDVNSFLNSKLAGLGLIQKEINDFKEFWVPEMLKNNKPYYFITFLSQRKIDQIAPLTITPGPDTVIRVMMDYSELEEYEEVEGFNIRTPERSGFTVVEWGGMLK
jgi:hypothetical protein